MGEVTVTQADEELLERVLLSPSRARREIAAYRQAAEQRVEEQIVAWLHNEALQTPSWDYELAERLTKAANDISRGDYKPILKETKDEH